MKTYDYNLTVEEAADRGVIAAILEGLNQHASSKGFTYDSTPLTIALRNRENTIVGGLHGDTVYGWLYISLLWVAEDLRRQQYGKKLIEMAEKEAVKRGCNHSYLSTFSFQALNFYQAMGYEPFGELDNFPEGQKKYFLQKTNLKAHDSQITD